MKLVECKIIDRLSRLGCGELFLWLTIGLIDKSCYCGSKDRHPAAITIWH